MRGKPTPMWCPVCRHPQRPHLEARLAAGEGVRTLAREYGVDALTLIAHYDQHVRQATVCRRDAALRSSLLRDIGHANARTHLHLHLWPGDAGARHGL